MADALMICSIGVGIANMGLAGVLLVVYGGVYRKARTTFTAALLVFGGAFFLHNLLVVYSYATMMPIVPVEMAPYLLGIGTLEAGGLGAMLWTATR